MQTVKLGRTGLTVNKNSFGALPIQRIAKSDAVNILRKAFIHGINYFDTARAYTDSEEKISAALSGERSHIIISTKTMAKDAAGFWLDLHQSLQTLNTEMIDIYQFHNPSFCPRPGDASGLYDAMLEARRQGKIRYIGISNHRLAVAAEAVASGLYDTLQFPLSYLAAPADLELAAQCRLSGMGFIAMKALSGGLITNATLAYAFLAQFDHVVPIWGIQHERELDDFLALQDNPPILDKAMRRQIEADRLELAGDFCRGCGYCMPCPVGIQISNAARMTQLLKRSPQGPWLSESWQQEMKKIENCLDCGQCKSKCPYGLDTPALLRRNLENYLKVMEPEQSSGVKSER
ncbi:MAG TPA: aldo/keto reductase [Clostridiales bacterium]|nr:aldo/keto reductase [Clostridiales bacterium]